MINSKNKNYSFIAISKHSQSKKNGINATLYKIFTPKHPTHYYKKQKDNVANSDLSYVSPNLEEISSFKSKLNRYLHQSLLQRNQPSNFFTKSKHRSVSQDFDPSSSKQLSKMGNKASNKLDEWSSEKHKNIRQYMCQLSQDKRKRHKIQNKTVQLNSHVINQQPRKTNPLLIIRKVNNRLNEHRNQKLKEKEREMFREREVPIHHTQVYYFTKKHSKTEPEESSEEKNKKNRPYSQERGPVTINRILELREYLASKYISHRHKNANKQQFLANEIHPTVAIITTRQEMTSSKKQESYPSKKEQEEFSCKNKSRKDEEQISPWNRRNPRQFQYD